MVRGFLLFFLATLLGVVVAFSTDGASTTNTLQDFRNYVRQYGKVYANEDEYLHRYYVFKDNMRFADKLQQMEKGTARYGATKFADMTREEFAKFYKTPIWQQPSYPMRQAEIPLVNDLPAAWDWRNESVVTPVKNQGACGSCWAFSTTGNIEGVWAVKKRSLVSLSEQELVDCDKLDQGCNGGLPSNAYREIIRLGGLETEQTYHYKGKDEPCEFIKKDVKVYINDSVAISKNETDMAAYLVQHGPLSIGINSFAMQFYFGGISHPWKIFCWPSQLDHGVLIVGYGKQGKTPYWIVKNSWGADWGEDGYYRVYRGDGTCGLNTMVTSAVVD